MDHATGTLGLIRLTEAETGPISSPYQETKHRDDGLTIHYKNYVRQLPPQKHIDTLTRIFFTDIAWYYDIIDEDSLIKQLYSWNTVPYSTITKDPSSLPLDLQTFPVLLF